MKMRMVSLILAGMLANGCASTGTNRLGHNEAERADGPGATMLALGEESTLDDYLRYAALNNPGLEAAFND